MNLAGVHAVGSSEISDRFFAAMEIIYSFFSPTTLKRVIDTRWSAHYACVKALQVGLDGVVDALDKLCDSNENLDTRGDAHGILDAIQSLTFFFCNILEGYSARIT